MNAFFFSRSAAGLLLSSALAFGVATPARAHGPSEASALSLMLPVAVAVSVPVAVLSSGVVLTVVAVEASATGTVWLLESASDGTRASIRFTGRAGEAVLVGAGIAVVVTALSTGCVLSAAGRAIAFVPNEIGASLLHSERLTY